MIIISTKNLTKIFKVRKDNCLYETVLLWQFERVKIGYISLENQGCWSRFGLEDKYDKKGKYKVKPEIYLLKLNIISKNTGHKKIIQ